MTVVKLLETQKEQNSKAIITFNIEVLYVFSVKIRKKCCMHVCLIMFYNRSEHLVNYGLLNRPQTHTVCPNQHKKIKLKGIQSSADVWVDHIYKPIELQS